MMDGLQFAPSPELTALRSDNARLRRRLAAMCGASSAVFTIAATGSAQ